MAMALRGKNRHYSWSTIQLRYWYSMAEKCQFSVVLMQEIIDDVYDNMENVIDSVTKELPHDFPSFICDSVFFGMRQIKNRLKNDQ